MRLFNVLAGVSLILWAYLLLSTGQHVLWLVENSRQTLHPIRMAFNGVPAIMFLLTLGSVVAIKIIERRAANYRADYSHRLAPIPIFCLLLWLPYLLMLFIVG